MTHDQELMDLMQAVAEKSLQIISDFKAQPKHVAGVVNRYIDLTEQVQSLMQVIFENPEKVVHAQTAYFEEVMTLAQKQFAHWLEGTPMPIQDHRFNSDEWVNNPLFNLMSQQYLLASQHVNSLVDSMDYNDKNHAKRLQFFTKQYVNALSPANFIHSNPQIIAETIQSSGKNLLQGLHNLLSDIETEELRLNIKMTDTKAFKIGENIAATPGKVIFRNKMIELIQYSPQTPDVKSIPLLIIPPWINKYYILDLSADNSYVNWIVKQGITVFIISWVNPDASFANQTIFDYLKLGPLAAISTIKKQLQVKEVNALGFCIGGTLLATTLAYNKAHKDNSIRCATFLATMIDFTDPGDISVFIDEGQIKKLEEAMEEKGYLPGDVMASSFNSLRANELVWSFFIKNYLSGKNAAPFDILYWNSDSTNMPATMHSQYLRWMYLENNLVKPGKIELDKTPLDVSKVDVPTFFLSTDKDHIAPWKTTFIGYQLMQGPKRFVLGGSGHIAGVINPASSTKYGYRTNNKNHANPEEWLKSAKEHAGSWWPEWCKWLKKYSGTTIPAPNFKDLPLKPLMDAPGSYVHKK